MKSIVPIVLLFLTSCNLFGDPELVVRDPVDLGGDSAGDTNKSDLFEEATCFDSDKNGDETDLNCGGSCRPCADNLGCLIGEDCASQICDQLSCSPAECTDGIQNGSESDIDCGGICDRCPDGSKCVVSRDCESQACTDDLCVGKCDLECGGDCPEKCAEGDACMQTEDCAGDLECDDGVCKVLPPLMGWERTVSFVAPADSVDFYAYVRVPDTIQRELEHIVFEQNGVPIPSERADEDGHFWVYLSQVTSGYNAFSVKLNQNSVAPIRKMWSDHVAVFHTPGTAVIADDIVQTASENIQSIPGLFGSAGHFDGTAYLLASGEAVDELFPTLTISLWARRSLISAVWQPMVARQFSTGRPDDFSIASLDEGDLYGCIDGTCRAAADALSLNTWFFVTLTFESGIAKIYFEGELVREFPANRTESTSGNSLSIGGDIDNSVGLVDKFFFGSIDEVRLSANVHSPEAIRLQYISANVSFFDFGDKQRLGN